ncbi:MAG: hypothetical protein ACE5FH_09105 [Candidatus Zixiibacteriota bacterium]
MENAKQHLAYIESLRESLSEANLATVDFDRLLGWLDTIALQIPKIENVSQDLNILRNDYISRIGGMIKSIAAADRRRESWQEAIEAVESLQQFSAAKLVEQYRKTSARFRDTFPTSFGLEHMRLNSSAALDSKKH